MDVSVLLALAMSCAPQVHASTTHALVHVESGANPYAIGVVGGALLRQPATESQAVSTISALEAGGWNYSVGLAQINKRNFERLGLTARTALQPCRNLEAMQAVLIECFDRALRTTTEETTALRAAFSCYYSGNFTTGFRHGYVGRVVTAARRHSIP